MRSLQARVFLAISFVLWANSSAWAQAPGADQAPLGSAARSLEQIQRWFELEAPFSRGLRFRFDTRPVPTYETLRLSTYEGRATLLQRGGFALSMSERVMPAFELSCRLTCRPILEQTMGNDARLSLGAISSKVPESHFVVGTDLVRRPKGFATRMMLGFGGLLDF